MSKGKPPRISRKLAGQAASLEKKFHLSLAGVLADKPGSVLLLKLHAILKGAADPSTRPQLEKAKAEFAELAAKALGDLDENFFEVCRDTVAWLKEPNHDSVDPLGDRVLHHLLAIARRKHAEAGRGQQILMPELMEELGDHYHGNNRERTPLYSPKSVRDALHGLGIGLCPISVDWFIDQFQLLREKEDDKLRAYAERAEKEALEAQAPASTG